MKNSISCQSEQITLLRTEIQDKNYQTENHISSLEKEIQTQNEQMVK